MNYVSLLNSLAAYEGTLLWSNEVFTIWILKDRQRSVAVFVMGELVIVETLIKFI